MKKEQIHQTLHQLPANAIDFENSADGTVNQKLRTINGEGYGGGWVKGIGMVLMQVTGFRQKAGRVNLVTNARRSQEIDIEGICIERSETVFKCSRIQEYTIIPYGQAYELVVS